MTNKSYILDVIVKRLDLADENINIKDVTIQFDWNDLSLSITPSRINTPNFVPDKSVEFNLNSETLRETLKNKDFKMTIYRTNEDEDQVSVVGRLEWEQIIGGRRGANITGDTFVGECYGEWILLNEDMDEEVEMPLEHTCDIFRSNEHVGTITVRFLATEKCTNIKSKPHQPQVDKNGKLELFKKMQDVLNPNDVFFLVGNSGVRNDDIPNFLQACEGVELCQIELDPTRYQHFQGKLFKDFSVLPGCPQNACLGKQHKQPMEEFREIFKRLDIPKKLKKVSPLPRMPHVENNRAESKSLTSLSEYDEPTRTPESRSVSISSCGTSDGSTGTLNGKHRGMKSVCDENLLSDGRNITPANIEAQNFPDGKITINNLVHKILEVAENFQKEPVQPRTRNTSKLMISDTDLPPRSCPICCEDMSWMPANSSCPKCDFQLKISLPVEGTAYDENQTAEQILKQWSEEVEKFKRTKNIGPLGVCQCSITNDCINCQIRRMSICPDFVEKTSTNINAAHDLYKMQISQEQKQNIIRKATVANIVEEVLGDLEKRPTITFQDMLLKKVSEPDMKGAVQWARDQYPERKKLLDSSDELSEKSRSDIFNRLHQTSDVEELSKDKGHEAPKNKLEQHRSSKVRNILQHVNKDYFQYCKEKYKYPSKGFGHRSCRPPGRRVPKNMGWAWHLAITKDRRGWRPGAIYRKTRIIMNNSKETEYQKQLNMAKKRGDLFGKIENEMLKPTESPHVHIKKEEGHYKVAVYPLCDKNIPPIQRTSTMQPIEFTISKANGALQRRQIRECINFAEYLKTEGDVGVICENEKNQYDIAIKNLKELLAHDNLRNILQSETESEISVDIDFGELTTIEKSVSKRNVSIQMSDDLKRTHDQFQPSENQIPNDKPPNQSHSDDNKWTPRKNSPSINRERLQDENRKLPLSTRKDKPNRNPKPDKRRRSVRDKDKTPHLKSIKIDGLQQKPNKTNPSKNSRPDISELQPLEIPVKSEEQIPAASPEGNLGYHKLTKPPRKKSMPNHKIDKPKEVKPKKPLYSIIPILHRSKKLKPPPKEQEVKQKKPLRQFATKQRSKQPTTSMIDGSLKNLFTYDSKKYQSKKAKPYEGKYPYGPVSLADVKFKAHQSENHYLLENPEKYTRSYWKYIAGCHCRTSPDWSVIRSRV